MRLGNGPGRPPIAGVVVEEDRNTNLLPDLAPLTDTCPVEASRLPLINEDGGKCPVDSGGVSCWLQRLLEVRTYLICTISIDPKSGSCSEHSVSGDILEV